MDERRMTTLQRKAGVIGLTDQEEEELGRLLAEAAGRLYSNAAQRLPEMSNSSATRPRSRLFHWFTRGGTGRPFARSHSLEIGQTADAPEDVLREDERRALSRR